MLVEIATNEKSMVPDLMDHFISYEMAQNYKANEDTNRFGMSTWWNMGLSKNYNRMEIIDFRLDVSKYWFPA